MRILMLNYEFPPLGGGASPVGFEIAKRLTETHKCKIDVVTMGFSKLPQYQKINKNLQVYRVRCIRRKKEISQPLELLTYLVSGYLKSINLIKKNKYDVCHCHFIIPTGILALLLKIQYKLPYIISVHGSDVPGYNPDRFTFLHKFTKPLLRIICDHSQKTIALSNYLKKLIQRNIKNYKEDKLIVIPNGINPKKFVPIEKEKIILSTGRLLRRKGFQYLIKAVSNKNIGYEVHICGDGPMMNNLKSLAKKSKTKIIFHGWINNKSKKDKELIGKAAIYCLVSEKENASVALLEAMSAGCAVITSNVSGCPETVGDNGIIVRPKKINEIYFSLIKLINDKNLRIKYSKKARKKIINNYNWEKLVLSYVDIFNCIN
jgi:glycosyltransferase involved in cell wall biosynthesis